MTFILKIYEDRYQDEPIHSFLFDDTQEAGRMHDHWKDQGYAVGLVPFMECGDGCPFRRDMFLAT